MEFTFDMNYNLKATTAMERAIRKGLQEERDRKSKIIGWIFVILAVIILLTNLESIGLVQIVTAVLVAAFAAYLLFQDQFNGFLAMRKLPEKMRTGMWLFREDGYFSNTDAGESDYSYENVFAILETVGYIILVFHNGSAQILDVNTIKGGSLSDFRRLLRRKTELTIQEI